MTSLFEVYDPHTYFMNFSLNWLTVGFLMLVFNLKYFSVLGSTLLFMSLLIDFIFKEFSVFFIFKLSKKSSMLFLVSLFMMIFYFNLLGLIPYIFSCSSHLVFSLTLSFPAWAGLMLFGWTNTTNSMFCHLIPSGTPLILIPLMVGVELVSLFIRPISLSVRLMSNMISGHLLMSLLGNCGTVLFFIQLIFTLFELFVCFIQAYVFSGLISLYSGEI